MTVALTGLLLAIVGLGVVASAVYGARLVRDPSPPATGDLSFYQLAYLAGGRKRVALTGLAYLVWSGILEVRGGSRTVALVRPPPEHVELAPVEEAILGRVPMEGTPTLPVQAAAEVSAAWVADGMPGLVVPPRVAARLAALAIVPACLALTASLALIVLPGSAGALVVVPLVAVVVVLVAWAARPGITRQGRAAVVEAASLYDEDLAVASAGVTSLPVERGMYIIALYGRKALTGGLAPLRRVTRP